MTPAPLHPLILCVFGIHRWEFVKCEVHGGVAELGRYVFFPNTKSTYECMKCRKQKDVITDYKGDVMS